MLQLDYKSGVPICDQIVNGFIRMKALGLISGGERLPSVRSLALELSVNPNTVQKAYQLLESAGIIYSIKGKGSFIAKDSEADAAVTEAAKKDFCTAVKRADELGLSQEDLIKVVVDYFRAKGGKYND